MTEAELQIWRNLITADDLTLLTEVAKYNDALKLEMPNAKARERGD